MRYARAGQSLRTRQVIGFNGMTAAFATLMVQDMRSRVFCLVFADSVRSLRGFLTESLRLIGS